MDSSDLYVRYHGLLLPKIAHTEDSLRFLETFQVQDDDVIAVTYPKSGTTWMQEILPLLLNGGDFTPVMTIPNWDRVPWLEETRAAVVIDKLSAPRSFVSHMPFHLMPPSFFSSKAKVIYVSRNPKDVLVSSFHFHQMASFLDDPGTFEEFAEKFLAGDGTLMLTCQYGPKSPRNVSNTLLNLCHEDLRQFCRKKGANPVLAKYLIKWPVLFGKWTDHVRSWKNTDLGDRILCITYEEMIQDLHGVLERILFFLGKHLSEEALKRVCEHCEFKTMRQNNMSNYSMVPQAIMDRKKSPFLRKGISGDWKNYFSPELESKFSAAICEELKGTDITFL